MSPRGTRRSSAPLAHLPPLLSPFSFPGKLRLVSGIVQDKSVGRSSPCANPMTKNDHADPLLFCKVLFEEMSTSGESRLLSPSHREGCGHYFLFLFCSQCVACTCRRAVVSGASSLYSGSSFVVFFFKGVVSQIKVENSRLAIDLESTPLVNVSRPIVVYSLVVVGGLVCRGSPACI